MKSFQITWPKRTASSLSPTRTEDLKIVSAPGKLEIDLILAPTTNSGEITLEVSSDFLGTFTITVVLSQGCLLNKERFSFNGYSCVLNSEQSRKLNFLHHRRVSGGFDINTKAGVLIVEVV